MKRAVVIFPAAALIGVLVALAVMLMLVIIEAVTASLFGGSAIVFDSLPTWQLIAIPTLGGLLVGLILSRIMPDGNPKGPADVIDQVARESQGPTLRTGLTAITASCLSLGCGASVGREGPAIHLAASMAGWLSRLLPLSSEQVKTLVGCAVAAAVSASFNAPLAGVVFAHEVVLGHYAFSAFAPVAVASLVGAVTIHNFYGDHALFAIQTYEITSYWEFPAFIGVGVVAGLLSFAMIHSILALQKWKRNQAVADWLFPAVAGAITGTIAIWYPQVLGSGYEATDSILNDSALVPLLAGLLVAKLAATTICLGLGFAGGIFSPALLIGATLGALYGSIAAGFFPELASDKTAYAVVGMSAFASAVLGAPFSTCLIILELTRNYPLTLAVLLAGIFATMTMQLNDCRSYFYQQLKASGNPQHRKN